MEGDNTIVGQEPENFGQKRRIPKLPMIVVALFVGLVGGYVLISSFAATPTCDQTVSSVSAAQSAVSSANPGQTVCLGDGNYGNVSLTGNKTSPGVTLQAQNPGKATIGAVSINGSGLTLSNFNTTGEVTIAAGSSNITVLHNKITGGYFGVDACNSTTTTCNDVKIIGNKFQGPYGEDAIRANRYHDVDGDGFGLTVSQNEFTGIIENGEHSDCLQTVWVGDGIDFDHNYEHDNHCQGFFIKDQNALCGSGTDGVCGTVTNVKVYDNIFTRNSEPCASTAPNCGPDTTIQLFGPEDKVSIDRNTMWGGDLTLTLRDPGWSNVSVTNNVAVRKWSDTTAPFNSSYSASNNLFCNTTYSGSWPDTGFTSNCNPPFPGSTLAGGDDFRLGGSQGVDWAPSQYTYGPTGTGSSTPPADTTAPSVSLTVPSSGATVSGSSVTVSANASDNVGVAGIQFKLDGNNMGSEDTSSPYSTTWNTTGLANGSHTLTAVARDAAGNTKTSSSITVTVDNSTGAGGSGSSSGNCTTTLNVGANVQNALSSAAPGAVICLSAGTWSSQTFSGIAPSSTVTLQPVPGATVHIKGITLNGPGNTKNLTVKGFYIDGGVQGLCGIDGNVVFQSNTIQHINAGNAFYFYANGCGGSHVQTGVSMLSNQMDHVGECLTVAGGASIEKNFTFKNNVCGPDIGAGVTKGNQYSHYIEIGCMAGGTFDNNAFLGPYDATALSNTDTATAVHNNVFHCFGDGSDISFSNNILWHTQSRAQTVLVQSGKMDNITIHNNLFVNDPFCHNTANNCPAQDIEVYATHGLNVTNNTIATTAWGLHFPSVCNDGCYASGTDNTLSNNIVESAATDGNADYSEWGCASSCVTNQNVSYDSSAVGSSSVKNWTPSYTTTSWTPNDGEPYSPPPSGYYVAKGLPFTAGWNGTGGPQGSVGASGGSSSGSGGSDTAKPTVAMTAPANGSTVSGIVTATASASDNVGVSKVEFYIDNASSPAITDTSSPYNYSFDSKTLTNGSHQITAKAYDAAGNNSSTTVTVTVNNADTTPPSAPSNAKATATSATQVNLSWNASTDSGANATGVAKYNVLRGGVVIAQVTGTSYTDTSVIANTTYNYVVQAVDGAGNVSANSNIASVTTPAAGGGGSAGGSQGTNCFTKPSNCGYPDATNSGVPAGTTLTPSGSITASTPGQVINGMDVTGTIVVNASNVTIENTRVTQNTTCGSTSSCGNYAIGVAANASNVIIKNVETRTASGQTCQQDIRSGGPNLTIENSYLHACDGNLYAVAPTTMKDSYTLARIDISTDHIENIYMSDTTVNVNHSTLFNPVAQTATIFGNVNGGQGGTCANHITATNSFLVGGGYTVYACAHGTGAGSSSAAITNNRFARCLGTETVTATGGNHVCQGGTDSHGYYPNGGSYGLASSMYSNVTTWSGNIWDDNGQSVCADGSNGCAGSSTGSDTTPPSTPTKAEASATSATQVNLSWNASTDTGGSGLAGYNVYRNGTKINSALVTTTTYGDNTASANTTYTYKIEAVDGAGNKSAQTGGVSVSTPALPDTTPPTVAMTAPTNSDTVSGSAVTVSASASDNSGIAGVQFKLDGNNLGSEVVAPPYSIAWNTTSVKNGDHTLTAIARDAAGNTKTSSSVAVTVNNSTGGGGGGQANKDCFSAPSSCGYPDATNTGVPAGTQLTSSSSIVASTPGQIINAMDVTGTITIAANNVTVQNSRVTLSSGSCGTTNTCGNYEIKVNSGVTGTVIKNTELRAASGITCEHDVRNLSSGTIQITGSYLHGCDSNLFNVGDATLTDSYGLAKIDISNDHVENIYFDGSTVNVNHSTLYSPVNQTAVIFGNVNGGQGGTCSNHLSVTNSLIAGGGYTFYPCGNGSSAGSSTTTITNNHFARCLTAETLISGGHHVCQGGPDSHGYYPNSGSYDIIAYYFSNATNWSGNVWDDNLQAICLDGNTGCTSSGGGTSDTTAPSVSFASPSNNATVSGIVTSTASASDNVGVSKVEFYADDSSSPAMTDTSSPYNYSFDSKTLSNGNHKITAKAYDAAGNSSSSSITIKVSNSDTTPPSAPTNANATAVNATTVNLSWNASTDSGANATGVAKYNVLRNGVVVAQVTGTSYTDTKAMASTKYNYTVQAVDGAGNVSSDSGVATVTTPSAADTTPPTTPSNLKATAVSSDQVNLTWNASTDSGGSGLAGYNIYRDGHKLNSNPITGTSYGDATVTDGNTYSYKVEAVDGAGNKSDKTADANVNTPKQPETTPPSTPTNVKATASSYKQIDLTWNASTDSGGSGLAGYNIYRDGHKLNTAPIAGTVYKDANVNANTKYQYAVQAVDKAGNVSDKSATVDATTPRAPSGGNHGNNNGGGGHSSHNHPVPIVRITVYDTHRHIASHATVTLHGQTRKANSRGVVQFNNVPTGKQKVTVTYGHKTVTKKVQVTPDKHSSNQHLKLSLASATTNPALLLVPVVILVGAALIIFRPWGNKLASAVGEPLPIVTSDQQSTGSNNAPQNPGAVYTPQSTDPTDKDKKE